MKVKKTTIISLFVILTSFAIGIYFYPQMDDLMASHWNARGEVDDYMSKFWGLFLMPFFLSGLFLLFILIPRIDPLKKNIEKFRKYFDIFIVLIIFFLFYIHLLTILWSLGMRFNMTYFIVPIFGILFYYMGILLEKAKRNWFIGIRTPWTLSSDRVWDKTHQIGAKLFKAAGVVAVAGLLFGEYALFFTVIPVLLVAGYCIIYSYFEYQKEVKK